MVKSLCAALTAVCISFIFPPLSGFALSQSQVLSETTGTASGGLPANARRGVIRPERRNRLSIRVDALVKHFPVHTGGRFKRGDVLVEFDCAIERAALEEARLVHQLAKLRHEKSKKPAANRADGEESPVEILALEAEAALASLNFLREKLKYCTIQAPYDGLLVKKFAAEQEGVSAFSPVVEIVSDKKVEFHFFLPQDWTEQVTAGYEFEVEAGGRRYPARLESVAIEGDAVDRSFKAVAKIIANQAGIPLGITATAYFDLPEAPAE